MQDQPKEHHMTKQQATAFEIAKEAMAALEFYRVYYASSGAYQKHHNEVIALLRNRAESFKGGERYGDYKFLMLFAGTLEVANQAGEYAPLPGASA